MSGGRPPAGDLTAAEDSYHGATEALSCRRRGGQRPGGPTGAGAHGAYVEKGPLTERARPRRGAEQAYAADQRPWRCGVRALPRPKAPRARLPAHRDECGGRALAPSRMLQEPLLEMPSARLCVWRVLRR